MPLWRRVLPFVIAAALVALVLGRLDMAEFGRQLRAMSYVRYLAAALGFTGLLLAADTLATVSIYRRLVAPVRARDFFALRGASYIPSLLNHHLGQGFVAWMLARRHGVSLLRVAGATLVGYAGWAGCILGFGGLALAADGKPLWLALVVVAGLAYLALIAKRPARLARVRLLEPLFEAGVVGHLVALVARVPHFCVMFLGTWLAFRFFAVDIPFGVASRFVPILMVLVTLPITPQGVGTRDAFVAAVFENFAPGATSGERLARLGAATVSWAVALTLGEVVFGMALMRRVLRQDAARMR